MSVDRFITWGPKSEVTAEKIAQTARDFLGSHWKVGVESMATGTDWITASCEVQCSHHAKSIYPDAERFRFAFEGDQERFFEVYFPREELGRGRTSVITRQTDRYTSCLADEFARIIAKFWDGEVEWPT